MQVLLLACCGGLGDSSHPELVTLTVSIPPCCGRHLCGGRTTRLTCS